MRVLIYSHVRLLGESLVVCLSARKGEVDDVRYCRRFLDLSSQILRHESDVVLFDMQGAHSLDEVRALSRDCPRTPIVALAISETPEDVIACAEAGCAGYVTKKATFDELCDGLSRAIRGECACDPSIAGRLLHEIRRRGVPEEPDVKELTRRENDVLGLVARGQSNKEVARSLSISVATVKNHLHNIFTKLRVHSRAEALTRLRSTPWLLQSVGVPAEADDLRP